MSYHFEITSQILRLVSEIAVQVSQLRSMKSTPQDLKLRRENLAKSLHATSAIEGNTLSIADVNAILDDRPFATKDVKQVTEIANAAEVYALTSKLSPFSSRDFLKAHKILMKNLLPDAGRFRIGQVAVWQGGKKRHVAPPAKLVPKLIDQLFSKLQHDKELPMLVRSCIAHYEIEFIHPFADGNGRMGRLWNHILLVKEAKIFEICPFESIIYARQEEYYEAFRKSDKAANSSAFVEFCLSAIHKSLEEVSFKLAPSRTSPFDRIKKALEKLGKKSFSRKDYRTIHPSISTATASRDLAMAVAEGVISVLGEKSKATYRVHTASKT